MVGSLANRTWNLLRLVRGAPVALKMFARRGLLFLVPTILLCIGSVELFAQSAAAQSAVTDAPDANPGRPTVSTPATLTPVAYLQFETGVLGASSSPEFSTRYGFNEVIKLAVAPRLEFFSSLEPAAETQRMEWARSLWVFRQ